MITYIYIIVVDHIYIYIYMYVCVCIFDLVRYIYICNHYCRRSKL